MKRLEGKIAFVTGGSRGIGRASVLALAAEGAKVAICYHAHEDAAVAVQKEIIGNGGEALVVQADIAVSAQIRAAIQHVLDQWGRIDILVNDAAITHDKTLRKMTDEEWQEVINADLSGVFYAMSAVIPAMIENKFGRIINISSYTGHYGNFGQANYGAAKAGVIGLTKTAALELARYNITVNAICPGYTETDMMATIPSNIREQLTAKIPVGRFAQPEEIAWGVTFLAADTGFVTGQELGINGGMGM
jgi:NAD(P)-dependent dehydrogenase (short-subunit alcohol dehydrogenase family)